MLKKTEPNSFHFLRSLLINLCTASRHRKTKIEQSIRLPTAVSLWGGGTGEHPGGVASSSQSFVAMIFYKNDFQ